MQEREAWQKVGRFAGFGMTMGAAMLLCGALGLMADRKFHTTPFLTVLLFLSGGACAFWYGIVKNLK